MSILFTGKQFLISASAIFRDQARNGTGYVLETPSAYYICGESEGRGMVSALSVLGVNELNEILTKGINSTKRQEERDRRQAQEDADDVDKVISSDSNGMSAFCIPKKAVLGRAIVWTVGFHHEQLECLGAGFAGETLCTALCDDFVLGYVAGAMVAGDPVCDATYEAAFTHLGDIDSHWHGGIGKRVSIVVELPEGSKEQVIKLV